MTMADPYDQEDPAQLPGGAQDGDVPIEGEPQGVEPPRRTASAQFAVEADVGSQAALREAMDPANQSLADALRLSFQVLQGVIVVLIALFFVSGFRTVHDKQSGVMLRFGKIVVVDEQRALEPGLHRNLLPYPAGEFVIFAVEDRPVELKEAFWPNIPANVTLQQAIDGARVTAALQPARDGYVLTRDGDLAHLKIVGEYEIIDPVQFVKSIDENDADRLVQLALQRAVVHVTAGLSLQELVDVSDDTKERVRQSAQDVLLALECGIDLVKVHMPDTKPPLAIVKAYGELQNAREQAREQIERARQNAEQTLIAVGSNYRTLARMIQRYEQAQQLGDQDVADQLLAELYALLESDETSGEVAQIIYHAMAYETEIESTLGNEARLFASILPAYREHPALVCTTRWMEAYGTVLSNEDAEIILVPAGLGSLHVIISGLAEIQEVRKRRGLQRRERDALEASMGGIRPFYRRSKDIKPGQARPLLEVTPQGTVRPRGTDR
ncbi:MAG: hypothetical protein IH983_03075 [Planctomycetes bacterium]|nr:hypothetical protein [Planctomycetota bacterium]